MMSSDSPTKGVDLKNIYKQDIRKKRGIIIGILVLTILLMVYALNQGAVDTTPLEILKALFSKEETKANIATWNIRLPRILGAVVAGAGLGISGCVMQTGMRNPLASPSTLGISNAAAFGANIAIVFFGAGAVKGGSGKVGIYNPYLVTIFAFMFSILAMVIIIMIARLKAFSPEAIVLAGVAFSSLFAAGTTLIQYFAEDHQIAAMVFWTFGDLGRLTWRELRILFVLILIIVIYLMAHRWDYNALDSGEDAARSLGVNVDRVRLITMVASCIITAVSVSFMGIIGFIGLIAPQMMRRIIGNDHRLLIPAAAATGAFILLFADTIARVILSPIVLPVGAVTSFFGAPLFLFLLIRGYSRK
ncbi:MAG: FecCD family ABC transporter permease [Fastidiosipilaceae bacterium]|jgi:iron complex transport system permease protein